MSAGPSAGRTLLVGDVHGCALELASLIALAEPARIVLLGDLFTKGPDPQGVWELVQAWGCASVLGNHDLAVLERAAAGRETGLPPACLDWLARLPLFLEGTGPMGPWLAVHAGVHPQLGPVGTDRRRATVLRRWPDDSDKASPFWWQLWSGPPLVIYGHDAVRGLLDRRPHSLGLDSGCVYGGQLTGFLVEEGRLLQVPAARAYAPVIGPV